MLQYKDIVIALIDDDSINNFLNSLLIKEISEDIQVIMYTDGEFALKWIKANFQNGGKQPDIIFLDINMPLMSGWELLDELKDEDWFQNLKIEIFMLSSSVYPKDIERSEKEPLVKEFLSKPLKKEKLRLFI